MTASARQSVVDDLLSTPSQAQVNAASRYIESFESTTGALVALVAALRKLDAADAASIVEEICEPMAELEADQF